MLKKVGFIVTACLLLTALSLSARGAQEHQDSGPITLQYWTHTAPTLIDVNNELIKVFEAENPGIKIEYTPVGSSGDLYNKLVTAFSGRVAPDVFWLPDWWIPRFAELGMAAKVPSYVGDLEALYEPGALEGYKWNGSLYTAGISEYNTLSLIYNKKLFKDAGVSLPSETEPMSISELIEIGKKLTTVQNGRRVTSGFEFLRVPLFPANWVALIWEPVLKQQGIGFVDEKTGKPDFLKKEIIDLFAMMQKMEREDKISDTSFIVNLFDDFANGRIAMTISGAWAVPILKSLNPEVDLGFAPFPLIEGGKRSTILYSWGWVVNPNTAHAEAAWKFSQFLAQHNADLWWEKAGYIQPLKGQLDKLATQDSTLNTFVKDFAYGEYSLRSPNFTEITDVLGNVQSKVMSDNTDVRKALSDAQSEVLQMID